MPSRASFHWVLGALVLTLGCQPKIGDSCQLHSDCSQTGDRICDPTFPGGYCTIFNCEPGTCPSEAVCVAYYNAPSEKLVCANPTDRRLERTFCMKTCTGDGDCRGGYGCVDLTAADNSVSAVVVERGSYNARVCTLPPPPSDGNGSGAVCSPSPDASFPAPPGAGDGGALDATAGDASSPVDASPGDASLQDASPRDAAFPDGRVPTDARGGS